MQISIFGMGYVGAVCGACLAESGHRVIGVDVSHLKTDLINRGQPPVIEPGLPEIMSSQVQSGRLLATTDAEYGVRESDISFICVGTPSLKNGSLDLRFVESVTRHIGAVLRRKDSYHVVVVRSTVLPGTVNGLIIPLLEQATGKRAGEDFGVVVNPEFLREGTAIRDYREPPMTVIGEIDQRAGSVLEALYADIDAPFIRRSIETAEMVKYTCNTWHAAKITFANEIGNIAKALGVDGRDVMDVVCQDRKLNISETYLKPGFAFGGSCLPKDVRALTYRGREMDVETPMLSSIMHSNKHQIDRAIDLLESYGERRIGLLGLSFKANTDDLRESPLVMLAETLIGKGYDLKIFDKNVDFARVNGANRDYINDAIPHVSSLLKSSIAEVVEHASIVVLGNGDQEFRSVLNDLPEHKHALDLAGLMDHVSTPQTQGICW